MFPLVVDCGAPAGVSNGFFDGRSTTYTSLVRYECNRGYSLGGDATAVCQANGVWSHEAPTCDGELLQSTCILFTLDLNRKLAMAIVSHAITIEVYLWAYELRLFQAAQASLTLVWLVSRPWV